MSIGDYFPERQHRTDDLLQRLEDMRRERDAAKAEVERLRALLRASVTGDPEGQPRLDAWQQIRKEFGQ